LTARGGIFVRQRNHRYATSQVPKVTSRSKSIGGKTFILPLEGAAFMTARGTMRSTGKKPLFLTMKGVRISVKPDYMLSGILG
jgi:hypothetical protein